MKKKIRNIKQKTVKVIALSSVMIVATMNPIFAAPGVNEEELKSLVGDFVDPISNVLIWVVPAVAVIGAAILGIKFFFKNEQEQEEFDLVGKFVKYGIVASILQSIAIVFKIFGVA